MTNYTNHSLNSSNSRNVLRAALAAAGMGLAIVATPAAAEPSARTSVLEPTFQTAFIGPAIRIGAKKIWGWLRAAFWGLIDDIVGSLIASELKKRLGAEPDVKQMHSTLEELRDEVVRQRELTESVLASQAAELKELRQLNADRAAKLVEMQAKLDKALARTGPLVKAESRPARRSRKASGGRPKPTAKAPSYRIVWEEGRPRWVPVQD